MILREWLRFSEMQGTARVIVHPTVEQITLEEARDHLRVDAFGSPAEHPDDAMIETMISAAREMVEDQTGRALAPQTIQLGLDWFPMMRECYPVSGLYPPSGPLGAYGRYFGSRSIRLPLAAPLRGVDSIVYIDGAGAEQTLDPTLYRVNGLKEPAEIFCAYGVAWPQVQPQQNAVTVTYTAGYDLPSDSPYEFPVPKSLIHAMKLIITDLYEERGASSSERWLQSVPLGIEALCKRYRVHLGMA